eukprot:scaffold105168_cov66-Phaeocystis_antarctica.AAC.1
MGRLKGRREGTLLFPGELSTLPNFCATTPKLHFARALAAARKQALPTSEALRRRPRAPRPEGAADASLGQAGAVQLGQAPRPGEGRLEAPLELRLGRQGRRLRPMLTRTSRSPRTVRTGYTWGLHVPASCAAYLPEAQGSCCATGSYILRVSAPGVPYVPRAVAPQAATSSSSTTRARATCTSCTRAARLTPSSTEAGPTARLRPRSRPRPRPHTPRPSRGGMRLSAPAPPRLCADAARRQCAARGQACARDARRGECGVPTARRAGGRADHLLQRAAPRLPVRR